MIAITQSYKLIIAYFFISKLKEAIAQSSTQNQKAIT